MCPLCDCFGASWQSHTVSSNIVMTPGYSKWKYYIKLMTRAVGRNTLIVQTEIRAANPWTVFLSGSPGIYLSLPNSWKNFRRRCWLMLIERWATLELKGSDAKGTNDCQISRPNSSGQTLDKTQGWRIPPGRSPNIVKDLLKWLKAVRGAVWTRDLEGDVSQLQILFNVWMRP